MQVDKYNKYFNFKNFSFCFKLIREKSVKIRTGSKRKMCAHTHKGLGGSLSASKWHESGIHLAVAVIKPSLSKHLTSRRGPR